MKLWNQLINELFQVDKRINLQTSNAVFLLIVMLLALLVGISLD